MLHMVHVDCIRSKIREAPSILKGPLAFETFMRYNFTKFGENGMKIF